MRPANDRLPSSHRRVFLARDRRGWSLTLEFALPPQTMPTLSLSELKKIKEEPCLSEESTQRLGGIVELLDENPNQRAETLQLLAEASRAGNQCIT